MKDGQDHPGTAIVTGASSGIGRELALCAVREGFDLVICADEPETEAVASEIRATGATVQAVRADLATKDGLRALMDKVDARPVTALMANAGIGLGDAFLDQDLHRALRVVELNVTGTVALVHHIGRRMRDAGHGRILITGSVAGFMPGTFQAAYNGSKAFLDSFAYALRDELRDSGVTVTCLMPGPTETEFFNRADMEDTPVGEDDSKADPADVAKAGFQAMMEGDSGATPGFMNKVQTAFAGLIPDTVLARMHRRMAEPGR